MIIIATISAGAAGYFYAKTRSLQKTDDSSLVTADSKITSTPVTTTPTTSTTTAPATTTSTVTTASSTDSRPSSPTDIVTVTQGQTLSAIATAQGVSWTAIAEANGIDADKIKIGQILIIPKNNQINFTVNKDKLTTLQSAVDDGKYPFRLTPADTAKSDAPTAYGLTISDTYTQTAIDQTAGSATVSVKHADKTYIITLIQPGTKGAKGIWAIESIKQQI